jgi:hypothetical protein
MNEILHNFQRQKKEILIAGDFNLDLLKINENQHIKEYFDLIMANGFLPKITLPTRLTHQGGTLIDNIFVKLSNHCVETTAGILLQQISDHQPCFLIFDTFQYNHVSCKTVKVYTNDSESISKFKDEMAYQCSLDRYGEDNPNANYDILHNSITTTLAKHLPIKTVRFNKHKHKRMKWITHGIIRSVKYRDKLYGKMKKARTEQEYYLCKTNLQTYNRILKQTIRNAKKQYYQTCFNNYRDDIRKTWKTINDVLGRVPKSVENPKYFTVNNETVTNPESIANEFNKYFVNIGSELANKIIMPDNKNYKDYLTNPVETVFEFKNTNGDEVVKIIDKLKPKTSCGVDGLSNKILKEVKNEIAPCLAKIINQSIINKTFPDKLKIAKVVPIFKNNEPTLFCNYRPVPVLPSISKIFERILHSQLQNYFIESRLFYESQYGFRPSHSTELAALELLDQIISKMDDNEVPLNIYLDLSKAFDTLDHEILLAKLDYYGIRGDAFLLMQNYLTNRKQYVCFNDANSQYSNINTGVPQGSILGPLLFLIYVNDINLASSCFHPVIYADDTTLSTTINYFNEDGIFTNIEDNINTEIGKVTDWLKLNKLSLNVKKTKAMLFHTVQRKVKVPNLIIEGSAVVFVKELIFWVLC